MDADNLIRAAMQQGQAPPVQIASPMNDVQLVALIAAQIRSEGEDDTALLVESAIDIVAEALAQLEGASVLKAPRQPPESLFGRAQAKAHAKLLVKSSH